MREGRITLRELWGLVRTPCKPLCTTDGGGAWLWKAMTFIFISPDPKGYKKLWKEHGTKLFYFKVLSKIEILATRQVLYKKVYMEYFVLSKRHCLSFKCDKDQIRYAKL